MGVNLRHGTDDVAVFEIGKGYARARRRAARVVAARVRARRARRSRPPGTAPGRPYDLDDAKGLLELLAARLGLAAPGVRGGARRGRVPSGPHRPRAMPATGSTRIVGEIHPAIVDAWELRTGARGHRGGGGHGGARRAGASRPEVAPAVGRFPEVERDLAIVVPEATPAAAVEALIRGHGGALLRDVRLFDIYRGVPLAPDEKSLAWRVRFGARTGRSPRPRWRRRSRRSSPRCRRSGDACRSLIRGCGACGGAPAR